MAYSQTISQTVFTTDKLLSSAVRRCKVPAEQLTSESWSIASDQLYLLLSDLANQGVPLWCIERQLYPLYEGNAALTLDVGTVDILNSFYRTLTAVTGTNTDTSIQRTIQFASTTAVTTVGIKWSATAVPLAFERSDDGAVWTTIQTEAAASGIGSGEWTWYDMDAAISALYFRIRATSGTLSFSSIVTGNNPTEIPLARLNRDDFTNLPNKAFTSDRVLQFWFDRQTPQPVMRLWPTPNLNAEQTQIVVWRHRHIMDVGTLTQEVEVPQRWYEAVVSGLACKLARELIEVDPARIPQLDADLDKAMRSAQAEERDLSPTRWAPNIRMYTA